MSATPRSSAGSSPPCWPCWASRPASAATSCSPPGARSSSGWRTRRPWSWCSRTSSTRTPGCSTSSTTYGVEPGGADHAHHPRPARAPRPALGLGGGAAPFTSIHLEPLASADMERLLAGLVPGLPAKAVAPSWRGRTGAAVRGRDRADAAGAGTPRARGRGVRPRGPWTRWRSPRPSRRWSPRVSTASTPPTGRWSPLPRSWGRASACRPSRRSRGGRGRAHPQAPRARPAGVAHPRCRPPLARAWPVRLRPGARPRGRVPHPLARDRRLRHLAAARYLESLGTDELAGAADHVLAAYRNTPPGPEADALAAEARTALRAAAARATALGSHAQAVAFLEQALEITTDPADRAALHATALAAASEDLDTAAVQRHAEAAVRSGDEPATGRRSPWPSPSGRVSS